MYSAVFTVNGWEWSEDEANYCIMLYSLTLHPFIVYYAAGLLTIAVSEEAITVDRSPPLAGSVNDGEEVGTDVDYIDSTSQLCVNWEGFSDPESGISAIQWAIGKMR